MKQKQNADESLDKVVDHLEEEARMILPGIQALFGFQLIAVFNQRFSELRGITQSAHFTATMLSALAVMVVMIPAAYHRQAEPRQISERLCRIGTICLTLCLLPLLSGITIDVFVIGELLKYSDKTSLTIAGVTFTLFVSAWFIFPQVMRRL